MNETILELINILEKELNNSEIDIAQCTMYEIKKELEKELANG
jgi:hypothetical protein